MRSFWNELRIVPRIVWPIALLIAGGTTLTFFLRSSGPKLGRLETGFVIWSGLFLFAWVVLVGYIYADAKRRGMRYIMWTLLSIFILYGIGAILYFVLRDPLLISCPKCGARCRSTYVFCPKCGEGLAPSCPECKRAVEPAWNRCAYCGKDLVTQPADPLIQS